MNAQLTTTPRPGARRRTEKLRRRSSAPPLKRGVRTSSSECSGPSLYVCKDGNSPPPNPFFGRARRSLPGSAKRRTHSPNGHFPTLRKRETLADRTRLLHSQVLWLVLLPRKVRPRHFASLLVVDSQHAGDALADVGNLAELVGRRADGLADALLRKLLAKLLQHLTKRCRVPAPQLVGLHRTLRRKPNQPTNCRLPMECLPQRERLSRTKLPFPKPAPKFATPHKPPANPRKRSGAPPSQLPEPQHRGRYKQGQVRKTSDNYRGGPPAARTQSGPDRTARGCGLRLNQQENPAAQLAVFSSKHARKLATSPSENGTPKRRPFPADPNSGEGRTYHCVSRATPRRCST